MGSSKINLINNPNLIDIHPSWKEVFQKYEPRNKIDYSNLSSFAKKYLTININPPDAFLNWINDKNEISEDNRLDLSDKIFGARTFFQKNEINLNSFCLAFGYVYIEKMFTEKYHFTTLLDFFKIFTENKNFQFISPQSLKTSINEQDLLGIEELPHYMCDIMIQMAEKLLFAYSENKDRYCEIMTEHLLDLFNKDIIFLLCVILFIKSKALEFCRKRKKRSYIKHSNNLTDFTSEITEGIMEIIAKSLKCELTVYTNEEKEQFIYNNNNESENFKPLSVTLFKSDMYHVLYRKKEVKRLFPKIYKRNSELKEKLCSFCFRKEGRKYEKCEHTYCQECLSELLEKSRKNVIKCPECSQCLGNKDSLMLSKIH